MTEAYKKWCHFLAHPVCMERCASDWPAELNDVTKSHPIADENAVSVYDDAEVIVVEGDVTRGQNIGN